jgi:hypothetical protein
MPRGKANQDTETLEMALVGFEQKKVEIEEKIRQIKSLLGGSPVYSPKKATAKAKVSEAPARKKRTLSAAARKRIALAQKKRWAEHRKNQSAASA